jgi:hypothetical protein
MKQVPYNTGKVLIGCRYDGPIRNHVTREGEWVQTLLLGEYAYRQRQKAQMGWYVAGLVGVFALIGWLA